MPCCLSCVLSYAAASTSSFYDCSCWSGHKSSTTILEILNRLPHKPTSNIGRLIRWLVGEFDIGVTSACAATGGLPKMPSRPRSRELVSRCANMSCQLQLIRQGEVAMTNESQFPRSCQPTKQVGSTNLSASQTCQTLRPVKKPRHASLRT